MMRVELYNEDCLERLARIRDKSIDLIATDPPYRVTSRGTTGGHGMLAKEIYLSGRVFRHNEISAGQYAPEFFRVLKDGTHCYVMTNHVNLQDMLNTFTANGFRFVKSLVWDKGNKIVGQYYMSQFEYILLFRKGYGRPINYSGTSDILRVPNKKIKGQNGENLHDTEKPVALMEILISNSSNEGDTVLDPFMGIGASGVASVREKRDYIGIEIDARYYDVAEKRIKAAKEKIEERLV